MLPQYYGAIFNIFVALCVPLALLLWFSTKRRGLLVPFAVGALSFFASQMLIRSPLLQLLEFSPEIRTFFATNPIFYSFFMGFTAGIFEEIARFIAMLLMKRHRGYSSAVAFGLGHGGFEAAMIGLNSFFLLFLPDKLAETSAWEVPLAGIERIFAVAMHVGWSIMVMRAVDAPSLRQPTFLLRRSKAEAGRPTDAFIPQPKRRPLWLLGAILIHGMADSCLGLMRLAGFGTIAIEVFIGIVALGMLGYILAARPAKWSPAYAFVPAATTPESSPPSGAGIPAQQSTQHAPPAHIDALSDIPSATESSAPIPAAQGTESERKQGKAKGGEAAMAWVVLLFSVAAGLLFWLLAAFKATPITANREALQAKAEGIVAAFNQQDYETVNAMFREDLQAAIDINSWHDNFDDIMKQRGAPTGIGNASFTGSTGPNGETYTAVLLIADYENGALVHRLTFDEDNELVGYYIS